jgi:hypothetical protein
MKKQRKSPVRQESGKIVYTGKLLRLVVPELDSSGVDTGRLWWGDVTDKGIYCFNVSTKFDYKLLEVDQGIQLGIIVPKLYELKAFVVALCAMYEVPKIWLLEPEKLQKVLPETKLTRLEDWITAFNGTPLLTTRIVEVIGVEFSPSSHITDFFDRLKNNTRSKQ